MPRTMQQLQSELEAAKIIADDAEQSLKHGDKVDWDRCCKVASAAGCNCKDYLPVLATLVRYFAGGPTAPIITFLEKF